MSLRLIAAVTLVSAAFMSSAFAQTAPDAPATPDVNTNAPPAVSGPQPEWIKLCGPDPATKKDLCQTSRDLRAETGQTLVSVALREEKGGRRLLIMALPPGLQIQPGVRVIVDDQKPVPGRYSVCFPRICLVEAEISDQVLATFRKGKTMNLQAINVQGRGVVFPIGLDGFAKAYDGAPLDPKVYEAEQKKLSDELTKRAEEALKQLGDQPAQ